MTILVPLLGKVLSVVWNIAMKVYPKFVSFRSFSKFRKIKSTSKFFL